jgi:hypothetical protein
MKLRFVILGFVAISHVYCYDTVPDERLWLKTEYLPKLDGRVLFVGVNYYNSDYGSCAKQPELYETIDLLPDRAQFGSPYKHHIGDFLTFDPGYQYDHVCLFGIMGHRSDFANGEPYNIDTYDSITQALEHAHKLLKMGGSLQVGPNRICLPEFNTQFWMTRLKKYPLNKYEILLDALGPCNVVWWGKKIRD